MLNGRTISAAIKRDRTKGNMKLRKKKSIACKKWVLIMENTKRRKKITD